MVHPKPLGFSFTVSKPRWGFEPWNPGWCGYASLPMVQYSHFLRGKKENPKLLPPYSQPFIREKMQCLQKKDLKNQQSLHGNLLGLKVAPEGWPCSEIFAFTQLWTTRSALLEPFSVWKIWLHSDGSINFFQQIFPANFAPKNPEFFGHCFFVAGEDSLILNHHFLGVRFGFLCEICHSSFVSSNLGLATLGESSAIQTVRSSTAHHQALDLFRKLAHYPSSMEKGKSTMCRCVVFCLEHWGHFCFSYMRLLQNQKNDVVFLFEVMMDNTCSRISLGWLHPYIPANSKSAMVISFSYVILFNKKDWYFEWMVGKLFPPPVCQICLSFLVSYFLRLFF